MHTLINSTIVVQTRTAVLFSALINKIKAYLMTLQENENISVEPYNYLRQYL